MSSAPKVKRRRRVMTGNMRCSLEKQSRILKARKNGGNVSQYRAHAKAKHPVTVQTTFVHQSSSATASSHTQRRPPLLELLLQDIAELGVRGIRQEFVSEVRDFVPSGSTAQFECAENIDKNRYDNIPLLDKTRVKLRRGDADYIHASLVHVDGGLDFICTQGPLENTVEQFWLMVLQEEAKVILQLCQAVEDGKEKSMEYFSSVVDNTKHFGSVKVVTVEKLPKSITLKKVTRTRLTVSCDDYSCTVLHVLYAGWPDHFVPDTASVLAELRAVINKASGGKPVVIHCSAGIGRTGTYVAAEMVLQKLKAKAKDAIDVKDIVKNLREQRLGCVQNDRQYLFIYRLVIEVLLMEQRVSKDQRVIDFFNDYEELLKRKKAEAAKKGK